MKRWLVRICVFLLLGAIVNVAVAWGLSRWAHPYASRRVRQSHSASQILQPNPFGQFAGREHRVDVYRGFGGVSITCRPGSLISQEDFQRSLTNQIRAGRLVDELELPAWSSVALMKAETNPLSREDAFGCPLLTLRCYYGDDSFSRNLGGLTTVRDGISLPALTLSPGLPMAIGLPLRPIWPGFAINTVFNAAVLWMLFAAPLALRRRRRIKRGLCVKCAYDLRGTPDATACPECGAKVERSS